MCADCLSELPKVLTKKHCKICFSLQVDDSDVCNHCSTNRIGIRYYDKNISIYSYDNIIVKLIREAKFSNRHSLWRLFTESLSDIMLNEIGKLSHPPILIPVPISKKSYRKRHFNQSEILAKLIAKSNKLKYSKDILIKTRHNRQQSIIDFEERLINPKGCYSIYNKSVIRDYETVFLLDDIFTTGSTINECARLLKKAGVTKVIAFTVAR